MKCLEMLRIKEVWAVCELLADGPDPRGVEVAVGLFLPVAHDPGP
jgi:hypothetical protein